MDIYSHETGLLCYFHFSKELEGQPPFWSNISCFFQKQAYRASIIYTFIYTFIIYCWIKVCFGQDFFSPKWLLQWSWSFSLVGLAEMWPHIKKYNCVVQIFQWILALVAARKSVPMAWVHYRRHCHCYSCQWKVVEMKRWHKQRFSSVLLYAESQNLTLENNSVCD